MVKPLFLNFGITNSSLKQKFSLRVTVLIVKLLLSHFRQTSSNLKNKKEPLLVTNSMVKFLFTCIWATNSMVRLLFVQFRVSNSKSKKEKFQVTNLMVKRFFLHFRKMNLEIYITHRVIMNWDVFTAMKTNLKIALGMTFTLFLPPKIGLNIDLEIWKLKNK